LNPNLHIIVRTRYVSEITELFELGANEVIPEEFETSIEIFSRVLHRYGTPRNVIEQQIGRIREQGYEMLRSPAAPIAPVAVPKIDLFDGASTETSGHPLSARISVSSTSADRPARPSSP
jgi:CPA2 family monovalent cation:H+ antiporter-2